jgi:hypothetical protein
MDVKRFAHRSHIPRVGTQCNEEPLFEAFMPTCSGQGLVVGSKSVSNDKTCRELAKSPITNACRVSCSQKTSGEARVHASRQSESVEVRDLVLFFTYYTALQHRTHAYLCNPNEENMQLLA